MRRGVTLAPQGWAVGDGAPWCQHFYDWHCPAAVRILDWAHGGALLQQDGQLPGTRFTDGPDYVSTAKKAIGASVSDPLVDRDVSSFAGWRGTADWINSATSNGSLPGGGEMGTGTGTKGKAVLSGSVTKPPQPSAQRSLATQNLAAAAAVASNAIVLENQKQGNPESEWGIDTASTNIEGFATDISVDNGTLTPYQQVYADFDRYAQTSLDRGYVPLSIKDYVRDYFSSLDPSQ